MEAVVSIDEFLKDQEIFLLDGKKEIAHQLTTLEDLPDVLYSLQSDYGFTDVMMAGAPTYCEGIANKIEEARGKQYSNLPKLNFKYVQNV